MSTPAEFFDKKAKELEANPEALKGINATYQFTLTGEPEGSWVMKLTDDEKSVAVGADEGADCTITMDAGDFMAMLDGRLNPQMAFMTGKLKVAGEMGLALKLQAILA